MCDMFCKYVNGLKRELLTFPCQTEMRNIQEMLKQVDNGPTGQPDDQNCLIWR